MFRDSKMLFFVEKSNHSYIWSVSLGSWTCLQMKKRRKKRQEAGKQNICRILVTPYGDRILPALPGLVFVAFRRKRGRLMRLLVLRAAESSRLACHILRDGNPKIKRVGRERDCHKARGLSKRQTWSEKELGSKMEVLFFFRQANVQIFYPSAQILGETQILCQIKVRSESIQFFF